MGDIDGLTNVQIKIDHYGLSLPQDVALVSTDDRPIVKAGTKKKTTAYVHGHNRHERDNTSATDR